MQRHPLELARRWHEQAAEDITDAQRSLRDGRYHIVCFMAQQSTEKALQGLLHWTSGDAPRIHLIETLAAELATTTTAMENGLRARAIALDKYYTTTRYPDVLDYALPSASFTRQEAELALATAQAVVEFVNAVLKEAAEENAATE